MTSPKWTSKASGFVEDTMSISGKEIPVRRGQLVQADLCFWPNNPRIYSIVHATEEPLGQDEIQLALQEMEHVRELIRAIRHHGGLIDPIVVLDESFHVIEGNSRLAAIRFLAQQHPIKYGQVRAILLPADTEDKYIYSYLNQEHLQGKTEWSPYEQSGVIYRLIQSGMTYEQLSEDMNITTGKAEKMYEVYEFMVTHNEDKPSRFSYYDVYLRNRKARQRRSAEPHLDRVIVNEIRDGTVTAQEFRDKLPHVMGNDKQFARLVSGKSSFLGAFELLQEEGKTDDLVVKLRRMHDQLKCLTQEDFDRLNRKGLKDATYRIDKLLTALNSLKEMLSP